MQALVAVGGRIDAAVQEVENRTPRPHEALVRVRATSLNRGELRALEEAPAGARLGWDVAGEVLEPAADGSGPAAGTRVVGLVQSGGWAELVAVRTDQLAPIPDDLSFEAAATLPVAGLTAWRALQVPSTVQDKRVLVTGAAGGVGRFAVQLAGAHLGAQVTAVVGSEAAAGLRELGAHDVVVGMPEDGAYDVILESVGGESLTRAIDLLARRGCIVSFGASGGDVATFDVRAFYRKGGAQLYGLLVFEEIAYHQSGALDLGYLADLMAHGGLDPQIGLTASWHDAGRVFEALRSRQVAGKATLRLD